MCLLPVNLPYKQEPLPIYLAAASRTVVRDTFVKIEEPLKPELTEGATDVMVESEPGWGFETIGEFYSVIIRTIKHLNAKGIIPWPSDPLDPRLKLQLSAGQSYYPHLLNGNLIVVKDEATALEALKIIQVQGEGADILRKTEVNKSHWERFLEILSLPADWEKLVVPADGEATKLINAASYPLITKANAAFNAAYCYSLKCMDKIYHTTDEKAKTEFIKAGLFGIMKNIMTPIARILMRLPLGDRNAGPTFEYFYFQDKLRSGKSAKVQLKNVISVAATAFANAGQPDASDWDPIISAADNLADADM